MAGIAVCEIVLPCLWANLQLVRYDGQSVVHCGAIQLKVGLVEVNLG